MKSAIDSPIAGLGDEVERALGQRVDGAGAVGGGEGGDDDDRDRLGLAGAQRAQHAEAVEARHVQVEGHRVGPVLVQAASASSPSAAVATTSKP